MKTGFVLSVLIIAVLILPCSTTTFQAECIENTTFDAENRINTQPSQRVFSAGPLRETLVNVTLIKGYGPEMEKIQNMLDHPNRYLFPFGLVRACWMDILITYKRDILPIRFYLNYFTTIGEYPDRQLIFNKAHTVFIRDFQGLFFFMKPPPFRPAHFAFQGSCRHCTLTESSLDSVFSANPWEQWVV